MKHAPQPWFPIAASSVVDGTSARDCLVSFGADPESVDAMFERHPEVREYDVATEIAPRMSYLQFLEGRGELGDGRVAECAASSAWHPRAQVRDRVRVSLARVRRREQAVRRAFGHAERMVGDGCRRQSRRKTRLRRDGKATRAARIG